MNLSLVGRDQSCTQLSLTPAKYGTFLTVMVSTNFVGYFPLKLRVMFNEPSQMVLSQIRAINVQMINNVVQNCRQRNVD